MITLIIAFTAALINSDVLMDPLVNKVVLVLVGIEFAVYTGIALLL